MSHATLAQPFLSTTPDFSAIKRGLRISTHAFLATVQSVTLAAILWLLLAGPGFLQDLASTVPLR